jgi:hypothetical protein
MGNGLGVKVPWGMRGWGIGDPQSPVKLAAVNAAAGRSLFSFDPGLYDVARATHARCHTDRIDRAIIGTSAALHAAIQIDNPGFVFLYLDYAVRANGFTLTASCTK